MHADALKSIADNYAILQQLFAESLEHVRDTEMKARIQGVAGQMRKFDFMFGVALGSFILRHSDILSRNLQRDDISAAERQEIASITGTTLQAFRTISKFNEFFENVKGVAEEFDVAEPALP